MTLAALRLSSPFAKGRASAAITKANKRKACLAAVAKRDWRRLKQVPNAQRKHRSRAEIERMVKTIDSAKSQA